MIIKIYDNNHFLVGCDDKDLLESMQNRMDGKKVRMQNQILIPLKSGPKIYRFQEYGIKWIGNSKDVVDKIVLNISKRKENIRKIREQYGGDIKFDYECKGIYEPMSHQKVMFNVMAYCDIAAILSEPGTCKTASYLWAIDKRIIRGQIKRALVVTLSTIKDNVMGELLVQVPHLNGVILGNKVQADKILNKKYKHEKDNVDYDIYISNYESMFSLVELFDDNFFDMVIMDEAHRIGSPTSRQTKSIIKKFEFVPYKYIVTGSLNANNLMSFYMPYRFLGPDTVPYANYYEFRRQHMRTVDPDGHIWKTLSGSINKVKKIIGNIAISFTKDECLDLPPIIYEKFSCKMEKKQSELYKQMSNDLITEIDDMCGKCNKQNNCDGSCESQLIAKNALVAAQKLRQIASGFYINTRIRVDEHGKEIKESNVIELDENPKLDLMIQILNNMPEEKQVIIWTNYTYANKMIADRLSKAFGENSYLTCLGRDDAFEKIKEFRETKKRFMVSNPSKMGVGHNIQFSHYQAFFSNSYSWIERDQAESRQHRKGQNNKVTVMDFITENSIDELIIKAIMNKEDLSIKLSELAVILKKNK